MNKTCVLNETVSLMALGSGIWEYYNITCKEDLIEAYKDFDERIAFGGDIELQYIDGLLSGYSCSVFEDLDLIEDYEEREEMQELYYDEIENVYQFLKANKINCMEWEQIDDYRFNIDIKTGRGILVNEIINGYMKDIDQLLGINDIAFSVIENYDNL